MSENTPPSDRPKVNNAAQVLRAVLVVCAVLLLVCGCMIGGMEYMQTPNPTTPVIMRALAAVMAGLFSAILLVAVSSIVGMLAAGLARREAAPADDVRPALERLEQSLRLLNNMTTPAGGPAAAVTSPAEGRTQQHVLEQVRDIVLMSDEQRQRLATKHWAHRKQSHLDAIERDVLVGNWGTVFARLDELEIVLPGDTQVADMRERVESEQTARLEEDLRVARARIRQLSGNALWQQAEDLAAAVAGKYPGKAEALRLIEDVRRERESWERESQERLFRDIAAATERRQWRQALLACEEFIRRYPLDGRADALRLDLPTLQENAAAQDRKEQEEQFKDLLKRQRYDEAIAIARNVIARYPQSATATELNKLLPKVEELARQEAARTVQAAERPAMAGA